MGRMAEKWEEQRPLREAQEMDDFDWQAALMADPAFDAWLDMMNRSEHDDRGEREC